MRSRANLTRNITRTIEIRTNWRLELGSLCPSSEPQTQFISPNSYLSHQIHIHQAGKSCRNVFFHSKRVANVLYFIRNVLGTLLLYLLQPSHSFHDMYLQYVHVRILTVDPVYSIYKQTKSTVSFMYSLQ